MMSSDGLGRLRSRRRAIPFLLLAVLTVGSLIAIWASAGKVVGLAVGPEGVVVINAPDLAPASTTLSGLPVDGVSCQTQASEVVKYHIHSHISIFVNGQAERLPAGIGITSPRLSEHYPTGTFYDVGLYDCLYWLHTHAYDNIVHVEAPAKATFTLGQFFDVWGQPLSARRVGPAKGRVVIFENGRRLSGDPRTAPLLAHADIQIDVGRPVVAFQPFRYSVSGGCGSGTTSCSINTMTMSQK